ncbi:MAG: hypothetical protein QG635_1140, partial [Bacteroidota bacterium]|nr:hypothetical protein [Bacteroidota bacterium]
MKVLITGASGFVGSHIADILIKRDYEVRCAVRGTSSLRWLEGKNIDIVDASLYIPGSLIRAVEGIDYIVHSAGLTFGRNMDEFLITNRDGTRNLLAAAEKYAPNLKRFVYISSQSAAGPSDSLVNPKTEESPCNPITSYGKSKLAGEDEVLKLC